RGHRGQPLPLHRLPEHRPGRAAGRGRDERLSDSRRAGGSAGMTVTEDRPATEAPVKEVGQARRRKEDARLITGRTTWTDNLVLPGMLHLAIVRSPVAHAKIRNVDTEAARSAPGVIAVFSGRD